MDIIEQIRQGDIRTSARLMRDIDEGLPQAREILKALHQYTGHAHVIGITGAPGVGKSTLTDRLIQYLREQNHTVGVVAVDPTSPFSGGAILGDRIRMQRHALDEGVFIRSLATRGHFGGLTASARAIITVMDGMGKDFILVETVGVGQDEVEIASAAHTTLVVTVPGMGDDIQAIKAGILEIADLFVINKSDREGADRTYQDLINMIDLRGEAKGPHGWHPHIYRTEANKGIGVPELMAGIQEHRNFFLQGDGHYLGQALQQRTRVELLDLIHHRVQEAIRQHVMTNGLLEQMVQDIIDKKTDPYSASEAIIARIMSTCEW
jgi:LAO/AO transport system kinase